MATMKKKCKVFREGVLQRSRASMQQPFLSFPFYDQQAALWNALKGKSINPLHGMQGSVKAGLFAGYEEKVEDQWRGALPAICSSVS